LNLTDEDDPINEISRIEAELEELAEVCERCRKVILVSKAAIAGGVVLPLLMMLGLFGSNQVAAIGSITVVLGRNRVARIERQYIATDNGPNARRRGAPFGSDQHDRLSSGRWQETLKWI
jgi:hypothetical protein